MEERLEKKRRLQYIKGLLLRIIIACSIFILLFLGNLYSVKVFDYSTDQVMEEVQDNSIIEIIEEKLNSIFTKE